MYDDSLFLHPLHKEMYVALDAAGGDKTEDRPKLFLDGRRVDLKAETGELSGKAARLSSTNDKTFPAIASRLDVERLSIDEMRGADLSALAGCSRLTHLSIDWATKLADLSVLAEFAALEFLEITDAPKIASIAPIGGLTNLRWLCYRGGMENANRADTLAHLAGLSNLEALVLLNLKIDEGGLRPLAALTHLQELIVSNQFETADYAYLSVHLPDTRCEAFQPYQKVLNERYGDIMVTGKRKPFLKSREAKDQARLAKYVAAFETMQAEFRQR